MKPILKSFGFWLLRQEWFQESVLGFVKEKVQSTETTTDDKLVEFLKRNKTDLVKIAKREAKLTETPVDDELVEILGGIQK